MISNSFDSSLALQILFSNSTDLSVGDHNPTLRMEIRANKGCSIIVVLEKSRWKG